MIIDQYVELRVGNRIAKYWRGKGYDIPPVRDGVNLKVKVSDLQPNSNVRVRCLCPRCSKIFTNRYGRAIKQPLCRHCFRVTNALGNTHGSATKGRPNHKLRGPNNPNWNPNKGALKAYTSTVRNLTESNYKQHKKLINPNDHPRRRCGVPGGWQLDHIITVAEGFEKNIPPEQIAAVSNLQMLPWKENNLKRYRKVSLLEKRLINNPQQQEFRVKEPQ